MAMAVSGVVLDTSVVVRHFRDGNAVVGRLAGFEVRYLPQVALGELYAGAFRSARTERGVEQIVRFLQAVEVVLPDEGLAEVYGKISAQLAKNGTPIPQNDIWIAACALRAGLPLATCDGHFKEVNGLTVLAW